MPTVYNGIGTWHYGKKNIFQRHGKCEFCGKVGTLSSYDTTAYFVFLMVPLFPLGKKRITDHCKSCDQFRASKLKLWNEQKTRTLSELTERYRQNPKDAKLAEEAISAAMGFQEKETLQRVASDVRANIRENPRVLMLLGLAYDSFNEPTEAEQAYRQSLRAADDNEVREQLAMNLIRQGNPMEASSYLRHVSQPQNSGRAWYLFMLAKGYQATGDHRNALQVLDQLLGIIPGLGKDKEYKKLRKLSEKNLNTNKRIASPEVSASTAVFKESSDFGGKLAALIWILVIGAGIGGFVWGSMHKAKSQDVWFVNGLDRNYEVQIAEKRISVPSLGSRKTTIPEGKHTAKVTTPGLKVPDAIFTIKNPFMTRLFANKTYVVNPDGAAPLIWQRTFYAKDIDKAKPSQNKVHAGKTFYEFKGINYKFEDFPETISIERNNTARDRIGILSAGRNSSTAFRLAATSALGSKNDVIHVARNYAEFAKVPDEAIAYLGALMKPGEFVAYAKPKLEKRPMEVAWHRAYQRALKVEKAKLQEEYRALVEKEPENGDAYYLMGRLLDDPTSKAAMYQKAVDVSTSSPYAHYALLAYKLANGNFDTAYEHGKKAMALLHLQLFHDYVIESMVATGRLDEAIAEHRKQTPRDSVHLSPIIYLTAVKDGIAKGREELKRVLNVARRKEVPRNYLKHMEATGEADIAYHLGDIAAFHEHAAKSENPVTEFASAITSGSVEAAEELLEDVEEDGDAVQARLLLYLAYHRTANDAKAEEHLKVAAEYVDDFSSDEDAKELAWAAKERSTTGTSRWLSFAMEPQEKMLWLTVLGERVPEHKPQYHALAAKLNYDRQFPYLYIKEVVGEMPQ